MSEAPKEGVRPPGWDQILTGILRELVNSMTAGQGAAQILCPIGIHLYIVASSDIGRRGASVLIDDSVCGSAFSQDRAVVVPDVSRDERYKRLFGEEMRSEIAVPLPERRGIINLESPDLNAFTNESATVIAEYCGRIIAVLPNALALLGVGILLRVEQEIQHHTQGTPSQAVHDRVCALICETAQRLIGAEHMQLLLPEDDGEYLRILFSSHRTTRNQVRMNDSVCGQAVIERKNKNVIDVNNEAKYQPTIPGMKRELVVIARDGDKVSAVMNAESSKEPFTEHDETFLALFAHQAGRALQQLHFAAALQRLQAEKSTAQTIVASAYVMHSMLHDLTNSAAGIRFWLRRIRARANVNGAIEECILRIETALDLFAEIPKEFHKTLREAEKLEILDLNQVVGRTIDSFRKGKLELFPMVKLDFCGPERIYVATSAYYLGLVVRYLISNAIDAVGAARPGRVTVQTRVLYQGIPPKARAELTVKDTGKGMDEKTKRLLLEPSSGFTTKEGSNSGGMGFGLSWVKYFASRFQAELKVESELEKGTIFCVELPAIEITENNTSANSAAAD